MALESTDLFVVQRQTGGTPLLKATATQVNNYINKTLDDVTTLGNTTDNDITVGQVTLPGGGGNTQALQKQEIESLIAAVNDLYVDVAGDNMTGDLTLGTDKITLDATAGSITAAGGIGASNFEARRTGTNLDVFSGFQNSTELTSQILANGSAELALGLWIAKDAKDGYLNVTQSTGGSAAFNVINNAGTSTAVIYGSGSSEFKGRLNVAPNGTGTDQDYVSIYDNGSIGVRRNSGDDSVYLWSGINGTTQTSRINKDGSAEFAGALEAASIDGGTY
jgi:hypothetical protein